eukprot:3894640-Prymnesium_polylepis.1
MATGGLRALLLLLADGRATGSPLTPPVGRRHRCGHGCRAGLVELAREDDVNLLLEYLRPVEHSQFVTADRHCSPGPGEHIIWAKRLAIGDSRPRCPSQ